MLTIQEIDEITDSILFKQADRLMKSKETIESFYLRPDEKGVLFELDCYENLRRDLMQAQAA